MVAAGPASAIMARARQLTPAGSWRHTPRIMTPRVGSRLKLMRTPLSVKLTYGPRPTMMLTGPLDAWRAATACPSSWISVENG